MRLALIALALAATLPMTAHAEPAEEAGSAFGACLAAVIDGAPVEDIDGDDVRIRRSKAPNSCTVEVMAGDITAVRQALLSAMGARRERFTPSKTRWDPGQMASRDTFCNAASVRRNLTVMISAALPGARGARLFATALETPERDVRCDADRGVQKPAA